MRHPIAALAISFSLSLYAGCGATPDPLSTATIGQSARAIIGGVADPNDPAIMLLVSYPPNGNFYDECTATLISPTALLTAAHCVDAPTHPNYTFGIFPGADGTNLQFNQLLPISEVHADPGYDANTSANDVGVAVLSVAIATTPIPVNRTPLDNSFTNKPARLVGYGRTNFNDTNSAGEKEQAETVVVSWDASTVVVGDMVRHTCIGDSGAPALVTENGVEYIIGNDSNAPTGCTSPSTFMRTDAYLDFLGTWLPAAPDMASPSDMTTSQLPDMTNGQPSDMTSSTPDMTTSPADLLPASHADLASPGGAAPHSGCDLADVHSTNSTHSTDLSLTALFLLALATIVRRSNAAQ